MFGKVTAQAAPIYSNFDKLTGQRKVHNYTFVEGELNLGMG
jgi:hypothetical protein